MRHKIASYIGGSHSEAQERRAYADPTSSPPLLAALARVVDLEDISKQLEESQEQQNIAESQRDEAKRWAVKAQDILKALVALTKPDSDELVRVNRRKLDAIAYDAADLLETKIIDEGGT